MSEPAQIVSRSTTVPLREHQRLVAQLATPRVLLRLSSDISSLAERTIELVAANPDDLDGLRLAYVVPLLRLAAGALHNDDALAAAMLAGVMAETVEHFAEMSAEEVTAATAKLMLDDREAVLALAGVAVDRRKSRTKPARPKVGRNDPCPCGSGKKWKRCCGYAGGAAGREFAYVDDYLAGEGLADG